MTSYSVNASHQGTDNNVDNDINKNNLYNLAKKKKIIAISERECGFDNVILEYVLRICAAVNYCMSYSQCHCHLTPLWIKQFD